MSRLKLFCGDDGARTHLGRFDSPAILNFESYADRWRKYRNEPLERARTLRSNDRCPHCRRVLIEPLELADGVCTRNHLPIPGTATLVGFHCLTCHWEWPA